MFFYRTHKGRKEIRKEGREGRQKGRGRTGNIMTFLSCTSRKEKRKQKRRKEEGSKSREGMKEQWLTQEGRTQGR